MRALPLAIIVLRALLGQDTRDVREPVIPPSCATLTASLTASASGLAEADEGKLDTARIQRALDECAPGHAVVLTSDGAPNAFLSGPLELRRGVTLVVRAGTILFASRDPRVYDRVPGICGTIAQTGNGCRPLINGDGVADAGVMGDGAIDGRGGAKLLGQKISWWDLAAEARYGGSQNNPRILSLNRCDNFTLYRITLRNSPMFHVGYRLGNGFTVWGVKIYAPADARNTDGIDPGNSSNITIAHSFFHTGDNSIAIKAGSGPPTTHITIAHNHFYAGSGVAIGSETNGGASDVLVTDATFDGSEMAIRLKSNETRGGVVRAVTYENICIRDTSNPIDLDSHYQSPGARHDLLPTFAGVLIRDVRISGGGKITLVGYDVDHRLAIQLDGVMVDDPSRITVLAAHAEIALGPGPVNFRTAGPDVTVGGVPGTRTVRSCNGQFVQFPK